MMYCYSFSTVDRRRNSENCRLLTCPSSHRSAPPRLGYTRVHLVWRTDDVTRIVSRTYDVRLLLKHDRDCKLFCLSHIFLQINTDFSIKLQPAPPAVNMC